MATCEGATSAITAPDRSAINRPPLGPMARSLGEIRAQEGRVFQPTDPEGSPNPTADARALGDRHHGRQIFRKIGTEDLMEGGRVDVELGPRLLPRAGWKLSWTQCR